MRTAGWGIAVTLILIGLALEIERRRCVRDGLPFLAAFCDRWSPPFVIVGVLLAVYLGTTTPSP